MTLLPRSGRGVAILIAIILAVLLYPLVEMLISWVIGAVVIAVLVYLGYLAVVAFENWATGA